MAIRFDASTDQILGTGWSGNVVTILCWIKIVTDRNDFQNPWLVYPNSGGGGAVRAGLGTGSDGTTMILFDSAFATNTGPDMVVGTWYCFAAVMNNTSWTLYYGTDPASLTTVGPNTRVAYTNPGSIVLSLAAEWFSGDLACFKIFTRALSAGDVEDELSAYAVTDATALVGSYSWESSTSLTPDAGTGVALTAGSTAVSLVAGPPGLDTGQTLLPSGVASGAAFGTTVLSQHITCTGIATGAGFGSSVVTQGQTVAAFGVASAAAVGSHTVTGFPLLRQSGYEFIPGEQLTFSTQFEASTAVAGNLIVHCFAGDVDTGTLTLTGTGWSTPVNLHYSDMTLYLSWKIAAGGELGASGSIQQGNFSGSQSFVIEYASVLPGYWVVKGSATNASDGSNVTTWPSGTTPALAGDGVAVAGFAVGAVLSNSVDSFNNSYTSVFSQGSGLFEAGLWVANRNVFGGTTTSCTITRAAPVTADQTHGAVVVFGKAATQTILPTGITSSAAVGTPFFSGINPTGIATSAAFGTTVVALGGFTISPTGIVSGAAFGAHVLFSGFLIRGTGIATHVAFGTAVVDYPARDLHFGAFTPVAFYLGESVIDTIYLGSNPIWQ